MPCKILYWKRILNKMIRKKIVMPNMIIMCFKIYYFEEVCSNYQLENIVIYVFIYNSQVDVVKFYEYKQLTLC